MQVFFEIFLPDTVTYANDICHWCCPPQAYYRHPPNISQFGHIWKRDHGARSYCGRRGYRYSIGTGATADSVRLAAIDTPERAQRFGNRSKQALSKLVFGKDVMVWVIDTDRYKRTVGIIMLGETDVNLEMVRLGYAWVYRQYVIDLPRAQALQYSAAEDIARRKERGLWVDKDPTPPWEWRRRK